MTQRAWQRLRARRSRLSARSGTGANRHAMLTSGPGCSQSSGTVQPWNKDFGGDAREIYSFRPQYEPDGNAEHQEEVPVTLATRRAYSRVGKKRAVPEFMDRCKDAAGFWACFH